MLFNRFPLAAIAFWLGFLSLVTADVFRGDYATDYCRECDEFYLFVDAAHPKFSVWSSVCLLSFTGAVLIVVQSMRCV